MSKPKRVNLNTMIPHVFDGQTSVKAAAVHAHFGDVATALERFLQESPAVVGCVAWLSSPRLVKALTGIPVALIINKEKALRKEGDGTLPRTRKLMAALTRGVKSSWMPEPLRGLRRSLDTVRCVGHSPRGYWHPPLMHHKFLVRLSASGKPLAVWTGSFNMTIGAESNLENAVEIHDKKIAAAYLAEFARVSSRSEQLDYTAGKLGRHYPPRPQPPQLRARKA